MEFNHLLVVPGPGQIIGIFQDNAWISHHSTRNSTLKWDGNLAIDRCASKMKVDQFERCFLHGVLDRFQRFAIQT